MFYIGSRVFQLFGKYCIPCFLFMSEHEMEDYFVLLHTSVIASILGWFLYFTIDLIIGSLVLLEIVSVTQLVFFGILGLAQYQVMKFSKCLK